MRLRPAVSAKCLQRAGVVATLLDNALALDPRAVRAGERAGSIGDRVIGTGDCVLGIDERSVRIGDRAVGISERSVSIGERAASIGERAVLVGERVTPEPVVAGDTGVKGSRVKDSAVAADLTERRPTQGEVHPAGEAVLYLTHVSVVKHGPFPARGAADEVDHVCELTAAEARAALV